MNLVEQAFKELFPNKEFDYTVKFVYSRAFSDYNANVKYRGKNMEFRLSHFFKEVSDEIVIGLIQSLLVRIYKTKLTTTNMELYDKFIKKIPKYTKKTKIDPLLAESFERVNSKYFGGMMEKSNLVWGKGLTKLGSYEYAADTIAISRILKDEPNLLDYVMYHEMLHKKHKFYTKNGRSYHHTKLFRQKEKEYEDPEVEKKLKKFLRNKKLRKLLKFW